jgi:hypothetical protein
MTDATGEPGAFFNTEGFERPNAPLPELMPDSRAVKMAMLSDALARMRRITDAMAKRIDALEGAKEVPGLNWSGPETKGS